MSQRNSEYARRERDLYETPAWVTDALVPHLPARIVIWEPASGGGQMVRALEARGFAVVASDIARGQDFLGQRSCPGVRAIVTNPPYESAEAFINQALNFMRPMGIVAMLLRTDWHHAKTRRYLFADCSAFTKQLVLTRRITWFDEPVPCKACDGTGEVPSLAYPMVSLRCGRCRGKGELKQSPSENHSWFIWDWKNSGPPTIAWGP